MKVCVITGGAGGMGSECARIMGKREKLLLVDVGQEQLDAAVKMLAGEGITDVETAVCDISNPEQVKALAERAASLGQLNSVIHLAGVGQYSDPALIAKVNAKGVYYMIEEFLKVMPEGSNMITCNSTSSYQSDELCQQMLGGVPEFFDKPEDDDFVDKMVALVEDVVQKLGGRAPIGGITYGMTKLFSWRYSKRNVQRFANKGIRLNTVTPGVISTPMGNVDDPGPKRTIAAMAMKRAGTPLEMATAICWLTEDNASDITGIDMIVDGGWHALHYFPNQVEG